MNIYLITRNDDEAFDYDTYDSAIVYAESEDRARLIHPSGNFLDEFSKLIRNSSWIQPEHVVVKLIGTANDKDVNEGVILASFNAG